MADIAAIFLLYPVLQDITALKHPCHCLPNFWAFFS